jgi:predicted phosphoribosyltransferase
MIMFKDRSEAGIRLSARLLQYKNRPDVLVLALPRGGVVTAYEIARTLHVPLDVVIVRKLGFPGRPELAVGAIAETGIVVVNEDIVATGRVSRDFLKREIEGQKDVIARRVAAYREGKGLPQLEGMTVILVDDGVATGATIKAAITALRSEKVEKLVVALPVGPPETVETLQQMVDELICLETPFDFMAVGAHYSDFTQVSDNEVVDILQKMAAKAA